MTTRRQTMVVLGEARLQAPLASPRAQSRVVRNRVCLAASASDSRLLPRDTGDA
jgi:hypothetical protein